MSLPKSFADSREATFRRLQRDKVRKSNLTRTEKEIVLAFLNHWFVHRHKGAVHPGRKKIAKRANASIRAVNYTFSMLREFQVIEPLAFERGNVDGLGKATDYSLDPSKLTVLCELPRKALVTWRKANQGRNNGVQNCTTSGGAKFAPRNNHGTVIPFRIQGDGK